MGKAINVVHRKTNGVCITLRLRFVQPLIICLLAPKNSIQLLFAWTYLLHLIAFATNTLISQLPTWFCVHVTAAAPWDYSLIFELTERSQCVKVYQHSSDIGPLFSLVVNRRSGRLSCVLFRHCLLPVYPPFGKRWASWPRQQFDTGHSCNAQKFNEKNYNQPST